MLKFFYATHKKTIHQIIKFGVIGGTGFIVDMGIVVTLKTALHLHTLLCGALGYLIATVVVYALNRSWTFAGSKTSFLYGYLIFFSVYAVGLAVRVAVMFFLIRFTVLDTLEYGYIAINIVGIGAATIFNFIGSKKIVFRC